MDKEQIQVNAEEEINKITREFVQKIHDGTSDPANFITMDQIESELESAINKTKLQYLNALKEILSNTDESEIIRLKKENTSKGV